MTDDELAAWLNLTPAEAAIIIPKLTPERRATYERMAGVYNEVVLWEAGVGPLPAGVIVCRPRRGKS